MREVVLVSGSRTAIGAFGGGLKHMPVVKLGTHVIREVLKKAGLRPVPGALSAEVAPDRLRDQGIIDIERTYADWDPALAPVTIDEVIMGNVLQAGQGQNPARQAMIYAGIPKETPACTVNMVCASGLKAIALGAASIMNGAADVVIAGGQENMSLVPMALLKARWGHRMELTGTGDIYDLMVFDGLFEIFYGYHMGVTAENIVSKYGISREEQDELSVLSHQRAKNAIETGTFCKEIVPILLKERKGERIFDTDERPIDTNMEKMSKLRPAFRENGTVTAGNASGINDAAAAVLLMSAEKAKEVGVSPVARIKTSAAAGVDPAYMGLGPVPAVRKALKAVGMKISDIDTIELNEAFAAQAIACMRELEIDTEHTNELGSGISLGHPIGCTGARQVVTGMYLMQRKGYQTGLVTMCIGGGMGMAMILER